MVTLNSRSPTYATKDDVVQASKAIFAEAKKLIGEKTGVSEAELMSKLTKFMERELLIRLSKLETSLMDKLENMESRIEKQIEALDKSQQKKIKESHQEAIGDIIAFVKSLPTPQVNVENNVDVPELKVPEVRIENKVEQADVVVNVPELKQPKIEVKIPDQLPAEVVVNIPEQKAPQVKIENKVETPEVKVEIPQARLVRKQITYDQFNRPVEINEEEVK